jgi:NADH:ubiquinone oxidoreductase subunit 6 (subunit J)
MVYVLFCLILSMCLLACFFVCFTLLSYVHAFLLFFLFVVFLWLNDAGKERDHKVGRKAVGIGVRRS